MELQYLRYFHEVAKQKSFSGAANNLHVSQPAVSKVIKLLEESLGSQLIDRRTRGLFKLTELGEEVLAKTTSIFAQVEEISKAAKQEDASLAGELHVGASDYIASTLLPNELEALNSKTAGIDLKLWCGPSTAIREKLLTGELDFGLFFNDDPHPALEYQRLMPVSFIAVAAPKFSKASLNEQTFIGCTSPDYHRTYPALELLKKARITPKRVIEINNFHAQRELTVKGFGFAVFPEFSISEELKNGRLTQIEKKHVLKKHLILARRKGRSLSSLARKFEAQLIARKFQLEDHQDL